MEEREEREESEKALDRAALVLGLGIASGIAFLAAAIFAAILVGGA